MYGIVLMAAMTSGAEAPEFFGRRCSGCAATAGCSGWSGCAASCAGRAPRGCRSSCAASSGCSMRARRTRGCACSCHVTYHGCHVSSHGCHGTVYMSAPVVMHGGCVAAPMHIAPAHPPVMGTPIESGKIIEKKKIEKIEKKPGDGAEVLMDAPARILVSLPADAKLLIDGDTTISTSSMRSFVSPTLEAGKTYTYTLKAEFLRDGKTVVVSKAVKVAAGAEINVSLFQADAVASR